MNIDDDNDIARLFSQFGGDPGTYQEISAAAPAASTASTASATPTAPAAPTAFAAAAASATPTASTASMPAPQATSTIEIMLAQALEGLVAPIPMPSSSVQVDPFHRLATGLSAEIGSQSLPDVFKRLLAL